MEKHVFDKLVLACKDEIVNTSWTTSTNFLGKKVTYEHCLLHTILLVILCLPLVIVISFTGH